MRTHTPSQRTWLKYRDDCAKAKDTRQFVKTEYQHRIAELQIQYGNFVVPSPVNYDCGDTSLAAVFYRGNYSEFPGRCN